MFNFGIFGLEFESTFFNFDNIITIEISTFKFFIAKFFAKMKIINLELILSHLKSASFPRLIAILREMAKI